jgi:hypothetical protein
MYPNRVEYAILQFEALELQLRDMNRFLLEQPTTPHTFHEN